MLDLQVFCCSIPVDYMEIPVHVWIAVTEDREKVKILLLIVFCGIVLSQETSHEEYAKILGLSKPRVLKKMFGETTRDCRNTLLFLEKKNL